MQNLHPPKSAYPVSRAVLLEIIPKQNARKPPPAGCTSTRTEAMREEALLGLSLKQ